MGAQWKQKHREIAAEAKGRLFSKLSKEISIAARDGADPSMNARLRMAIEAARKASMTKDTLARAIKKGAGLLDGGAQYEVITYEGFAPHRVPVVIECLTENRNRTATNVRVIVDKNGGELTTSGAVTWDFTRMGCVEGSHEGIPKGEVDPEDEAIEAGAQDLEVSDEEEGVSFYTDATDVDLVRKALEDRGWAISAAKLIWKANNPQSLEGEALEEVERFLEALDEDDDVQSIYVGLV